ncbi:MAG: amidohydrolase family protein [Rhodospirillales bacterium]|jgi:imidazolonepropionase-like amidohydrolase|nr:amidohydrolase family protein [Rhodospirillales bacterium]MDP6646587.1 amidohydrolase family protein [Rhodospirillales bacterium]
MAADIFVADSYFDGHQYHGGGPYTVLLSGGAVTQILDGDQSASDTLPEIFKSGAAETHRAGFLMPGMVEAHCHLFLDGGELDLDARSQFMKSDIDEMLDMARQNVARMLASGITQIRDAGDRWGINHAVRDEINAASGVHPDIRSPGLGIRRPKRYGGFMAREVETGDDIVAAVREFAETGDDIKIILTGIIDFATGTVKGAPQFDTDEARLAVDTAHDCGHLTFAHCSGLAGLEVAAEAGVDSVEHGFFMTRDILEVLAEKGISWVPTYSPVHFQWARPEIIGWDDHARGEMRKILDSHLANMAMAVNMGVDVVIGSDAGSHGVVHGKAVIDEIYFLVEAGVSMAAALAAATSLPRRKLNMEAADIAAGNPAELAVLKGSPFDDRRNLENLTAVYKDGEIRRFGA